MKYDVLPVGWILDQGINKKLLEKHLGEFLCTRDKQLEDFIHNKALLYESK
jgi:hypothetical protein